MSWIFARLYDPIMAGTEEAGLKQWRADLLGEASGRVLEIGAGTGINLPLWPDDVTELVSAEPDAGMRRQLQAKLEASPPSIPVQVRDWPAEQIPEPDASFDAAVTTLVLCTVDDPRRALSELRRVLRPEGRLIFLEHVAAPDNPGRLKWQRRIEPVWKHLAGGCHLTRDTAALIEQAGFVIERIERASMPKAPPFVRPTIRGVARKP